MLCLACQLHLDTCTHTYILWHLPPCIAENVCDGVLLMAVFDELLVYSVALCLASVKGIVCAAENHISHIWRRLVAFCSQQRQVKHTRRVMSWATLRLVAAPA